MTRQKTNNNQQTTKKTRRSLLSGVCYFSSARQGFTLVELLIVIAVITMIMVVVFPNFMGVRQRARDSQRKSELAQIQRAIELYKQDQMPPVYPTTGALSSDLCGKCWSSGGMNCSGNIYMYKVPCDPQSSGTTPTPFLYIASGADALQYTISTCLENAGDSDRDVTVNPSCNYSGASYTVHEP
jgi:prepilin-type N-terminal cleavage/methylation domain-containing protein